MGSSNGTLFVDSINMVCVHACVVFGGVTSAMLFRELSAKVVPSLVWLG